MATRKPQPLPAPEAANDPPPQSAPVPRYGPAYPCAIQHPNGQVQQFGGASLRLMIAAELFSRSRHNYRDMSPEDACMTAVRQADILIRASDTVPAETGEWLEGTATTTGYARDVAQRLHARLNSQERNWKPLPDLLGLLTQIDNMTNELLHRYSVAMQQVAALSPRPRPATARKAPAKARKK